MTHDLVRTCETCGGDGLVIRGYPPQEEPCQQCSGTGNYTFGETPSLAEIVNKIDALSSDCASIGDVCKQTLEVCTKILDIVSKGEK